MGRADATLSRPFAEAPPHQTASGSDVQITYPRSYQDHGESRLPLSGVLVGAVWPADVRASALAQRPAALGSQTPCAPFAHRWGKEETRPDQAPNGPKRLFTAVVA